MKHTIKHLLFVLLVTALVLFSETLLVSAIGYTNTYTIGKKTFEVVVSGTESNRKSTIYEKKSASNVKLVTYYKKSAYPISIYGNYLYLNLNSFYDPEDVKIARLNIKSKNTSIIQKNARLSTSNGRYAIANAPTGFPLALPYYIIDLKTGVSKLISKKCYGATTSKNKVYYIIVDKNYRGKVYVASPSLKNKKAVSGTIQTAIGYGTKVKPTYIAYAKKVNGTIKYYKYTYSSKKNKTISSSVYHNIK